MDDRQFTEQKTGDLVRVNLPSEDWAFIPDALPSKIDLSSQVYLALAEAHGQLKELNGIGRQLENPTLLLHRLQHREALRSSSLEGTYSTPFEFLLFDLEQDAASESAKANEIREVVNYNHSITQGWNRIEEGWNLSSTLIKELHSVLLSGVRGQNKQPGQFRQGQVYIGSNRRYIPPPPLHLAPVIEGLDRYLEAGPCVELHPLIAAFLAHYQFEAIHPLADGNGRVGRVLLSLSIAKWCDLKLPWLYLSPYFERHKDEYIDNMFRVSTHGDWERWILFCLRGTLEQANDAIVRCELLDRLRKAFRSAVEKLPQPNRLYKIIDRIFQTRVFETSDVTEWCGVSWRTAANDIEKLIGAGIVMHLTGEKPRRYYVPRLHEIAFEEVLTSERMEALVDLRREIGAAD